MTLPRLEVGLVIEDQRFVGLLRPLVDRLAEEAGRAYSLHTQRTGGCRPSNLRSHVARLTAHPVDVLLIGADAAGHPHKKRGTARQKERALRDELPDAHAEVIWAIPDPCVETWLLSELGKLRGALQDVLAEPVTLPADVRNPTTEQEAKRELERILDHVLEGPAPMGGFEYAPAFVEKLDLERLQDDELGRLVRDLRRTLRPDRP